MEALGNVGESGLGVLVLFQIKSPRALPFQHSFPLCVPCSYLLAVERAVPWAGRLHCPGLQHISVPVFGRKCPWDWEALVIPVMFVCQLLDTFFPEASPGVHRSSPFVGSEEAQDSVGCHCPAQ